MSPAPGSCTPPPLATVPSLPPGKRLPLGGILVAIMAAGLMYAARKRTVEAVLAGIALSAIGWSWWWRLELPAEQAAPDQANAIASTLLANCYRAFEHYDDEAIYDVLARSAADACLSELYLETKQAVTARDRGGIRVRVAASEISDSTLTPLADDLGYHGEVAWLVDGQVTHWGHSHQRQNRYRAEIRIEANEDTWKLTSFTLLDEERLR
ncbi:MAG: hypothetical protein ACYTF0_05960 [Planctomycetota bacterium]|jgi:hypothetical protein